MVGAAGRAGATPATLVLTGVALQAVLMGLSTAISLSHPEVFDKLRFWAAGSLQGRQADTVSAVLPFIVVGLLLAVLLARSLNVFSLGEDLAKALGARVTTTRTIAFVAITLLCGAATAAAGPITFFGLMVPFVARLIVGPDQRWIVAVSLVYAPAHLPGLGHPRPGARPQRAPRGRGHRVPGRPAADRPDPAQGSHV